MEIIPNVHRIPGMRGANVYLLLGGTLTLVDAGMPGSEGAILDYIAGLDRAPAGLAQIVITHHHLDHVGSVAALRARTDAQVLAANDPGANSPTAARPPHPARPPRAGGRPHTGGRGGRT